MFVAMGSFKHGPLTLRSGWVESGKQCECSARRSGRRRPRAQLSRRSPEVVAHVEAGAFAQGGVVTARTRLSLTIQGAMLGATTGAGIGAIVGCLATAVVGCIPGAVGGAGQGVGIGGVVGAGGWFILSFFVGEKAG